MMTTMRGHGRVTHVEKALFQGDNSVGILIVSACEHASTTRGSCMLFVRHLTVNG